MHGDGTQIGLRLKVLSAKVLHHRKHHAHSALLLPASAEETWTEAMRRSYFGLALSAAFSTAWPVALTSLPAPSTVLQPHNVASNAAASNALNVFKVIPLLNEIEEFNCLKFQARIVPCLRDTQLALPRM